MAKIILSGTMVRTPVGGLSLWHLAWLTGLKARGHEVYFVEKSMWENACYDVSRKIMTNNSTHGISVITRLFEEYRIGDRWCFVDHDGNYLGMSKRQVEDVFKSADLFIDFEWGEWQEEAANVPIRVFSDGDPGWFQMKLSTMIEAGESVPRYDYYFTNGRLSGNGKYLGPTAGIEWLHLLPAALIAGNLPEKVPGGAFSTIMNWRSNREVAYGGRSYGQKDLEFSKFMELPSMVDSTMEVAVSGASVPREKLAQAGWRVRDADEISVSVNSYLEYIKGSKAEFCVAKNVFVDTKCGWFGDRGAYYMSFGKPVLVQETGWTEFLPSGEGLLSFRNIEEAKAAIACVNGDYERHSRKAREIAFEYFDAGKVMATFLKKIGV